MRKNKYIIVFLLFFICLNVKAIDACTSEEIARLKELANNVEFKYEYEITDEYKAENEDEQDFVEGIFKISIVNSNEDLKIIVKEDDNEYEVNNEELKEMYFSEGNKLIFNIYSYTDNLCTRRLLRSYTLKLPYYSQYYHFNKEKCSNNLDFKYCQEFLETEEEKRLEEIDKEFEEFIKDDNEISEKLNVNNIYIIIIIVVLILSIGGFVIYKQTKKKKNDDL